MHYCPAYEVVYDLGFGLRVMVQSFQALINSVIHHNVITHSIKINMAHACMFLYSACCIHFCRCTAMHELI